MARTNGFNLGSILNGILNLFSARSPYDNGDAQEIANTADTTTGGYDYLGSFFNRVSGAGLTGAELEANRYTAMREDTRYQRQVADMRAAGLNPMLAVSSGGSPQSSPSVSPGSGSGLNLGSLLSFILGKQQLALQKRVAESEVNVNNAQAGKMQAETSSVTEETRGKKLSNDFFERMQSVREESERLGNDLKAAEKKQIYKSIDKADSEINLAIEQAKSEQEKRNLYISQQILNSVTAENIVKMRPYLQAELSARSESEKSAAQVATVEAAYKQGMIDEGAIRAAVRASNASASKDEVESHVKAFGQMLSDGTLRKNAESIGDWRSGVLFGLYEGISNAAKSVLGKW